MDTFLAGYFLLGVPWVTLILRAERSPNAYDFHYPSFVNSMMFAYSYGWWLMLAGLQSQPSPRHPQLCISFKGQVILAAVLVCTPGVLNTFLHGCLSPSKVYVWVAFTPKTLPALRPYLVGGWPTPLRNMSSSVGSMTFPRYGKW